MNCPSCSKTVEANWVRCPYCGQALAPASPATGAAAPLGGGIGEPLEAFRAEVRLALADGQVTDAERERLLSIVKTLGIAPEQAGRIMREEREAVAARLEAGLKAVAPGSPAPAAPPAARPPAELTQEEKLARLEAMRQSGKISQETYDELRAKLSDTPAGAAPEGAAEAPAKPKRRKKSAEPAPASAPVTQTGGGVTVADSVIKGNITSTTININAAPPAAQGASRLLTCPVCGKKNEEHQTACCAACGREGLCPAHIGPQGTCEECVEKTMTAHGLRRPKPPLPDASGDIPYQQYLGQNANSAWYAAMGGGDPNCLKGPLPVTPPGLIHECRRLCAFKDFRPDMINYWFTAAPALHARFRTCMTALEQWAFHYPQFRGDFLNLWMSNADVVGIQPDVTYFDRPDVRARHGAI